MRAPGRNAALIAALGLLLFLPAVVRGQAPGSIPPVFAQRLQIPVRGDDFAQPRAVVADLHTGEVFVCDSLRNRIAIFDPEGRFRYEIEGGNAFQSPVDLAVDPDGFLFLLSQVSTDITQLDFDGRFIRRIGLTGVPEDAKSPRPASLAISPSGERLFVIDAGNHRLWITDRDGVIQGSVDLTVGRPQKEIAELRYGHVDVYGDTVLIPIPTDGLVHRFDLTGRAKGTIGVPGSADCQTIFPVAAALDDNGRAIILDQQRALFMTWDLERGVCLSEHYGFGNAPGAFYQPNDLALDGAGRLYVSQGFEGRVQVYEGARPASVPASARRPTPEAIAETRSADLEPFERLAVQELEVVAERVEPAPPAPVPSAAPPLPEPAAAPPAPELGPTPPARSVAEPAAPAEPGEAAAGTPPGLAALLVAGARLSLDEAPRFDSTYVEMAYPGGDLPRDRGSAVDLVVRAFRHAGIDLQKILQEDRRDAPAAYPIDRPDPNIDHRRVRNLVALFERRATSLPTGPDASWAPGDVVLWDRDSNGMAGHLGVVTAETGPSGRPLVIHHHHPADGFPGTPGADDVLLRWPVVGHYRWPSPPTGVEGAGRVRGPSEPGPELPRG